MEIYEEQLKKHKGNLYNLLSMAFKHVPSYKGMTRPVEYYLENYKNWTELPILEKSHIQNNFSDYIAKPNLTQDPNIRVLHTSGSTGVPLKIFRDKKEDLLLTKKLWKVRRNWDKDVINLNLLYLYRTIESAKQKVLRLGCEEYLDLSREVLANYKEEIRVFEPQWMIGPPSAVNRLAQIYQDDKETFKSLKFIEMYGEMILPHQREFIQKVFDCPVVNHYGCRELDVLSYECPSQKMHAWEEHLFFEVLKNGEPVAPHEEGELVVTSLTNNIMPFIRYKIGDIVRLYSTQEECSCGKQGLILEPVGGRIANLVITEDKILTSVIFDTAFSRTIRSNANTIQEFQVVQKNLKHFLIYIVKGENFSENVLTFLIEEFNKFIEDVFYEFVYVDKISNSESGKTATFIPLKNNNPLNLIGGR